MTSAMTTRFAISSSGRLKCTSILAVLLTTTTVFCPFRVLLGQTPEYIVTELTGEDAAQVPSKLNNLGDIVGRNAGSGAGAPRATLWSHSHYSKAKHLGVFPGGDYSSANAINDAGEVAGVSNTETAILPFVWSDKGGLQRVPLLAGDNCGEAVAINKHGHVVSNSSGPTGCRAVLWTRKTGVRDLGTLPGGSYSRAHDLNDSDEVAGVAASPAGDRAVLWTNSGDARDLGVVLVGAQAINRKGEILAMGQMDHGGMAPEGHICAPAPPLSFLLTPTNMP